MCLINDVLFHRENSTTPIQIFINDLKNAPFDPLKPTKIIIHGFSSDAFTDWSIDLKNSKFLYLIYYLIKFANILEKVN